MIEFKLFFALISYYFVMFATPGPNNAMLTVSGDFKVTPSFIALLRNFS